MNYFIETLKLRFFSCEANVLVNNVNEWEFFELPDNVCKITYLLQFYLIQSVLLSMLTTLSYYRRYEIVSKLEKFKKNYMANSNLF